MDPKAQAVINAVMQAMHSIDMEYALLMQRVGVKQLVMHRT